MECCKISKAAHTFVTILKVSICYRQCLFVRFGIHGRELIESDTVFTLKLLVQGRFFSSQISFCSHLLYLYSHCRNVSGYHQRSWEGFSKLSCDSCNLTFTITQRVSSCPSASTVCMGRLKMLSSSPRNFKLRMLLVHNWQDSWSKMGGVFCNSGKAVVRWPCSQFYLLNKHAMAAKPAPKAAYLQTEVTNDDTVSCTRSLALSLSKKSMNPSWCRGKERYSVWHPNNSFLTWIFIDTQNIYPNQIYTKQNVLILKKKHTNRTKQKAAENFRIF